MTIDSTRIIYRVHAIQRMFERNISSLEVIEILSNGEIIEDYPEDTPYPSFLKSEFVATRPIHVVAAFYKDTGETIVITAYEPDPNKWSGDFKRRNP